MPKFRDPVQWLNKEIKGRETYTLTWYHPKGKHLNRKKERALAGDKVRLLRSEVADNTCDILWLTIIFEASRGCALQAV